MRNVKIRWIRRGYRRFAAALVLTGGVVLAGLPITEAEAAPRARTESTSAVTGHPTSAGDEPGILACSGHGVEYGDWVNVDPRASGIVRIELRDCQPVTTCDGDTCHIVFDAGWTMRVFTRCRPVNCDWGWSEPQLRLASGQVHGSYGQRFARTDVYAKTLPWRPSQLSVLSRRDFVGPSLPNHDRQEWFRRV